MLTVRGLLCSLGHLSFTATASPSLRIAARRITKPWQRRITIAFTVSDDEVVIHAIAYGGREWEARFEKENASWGARKSSG
jgi:hypothetical protein